MRADSKVCISCLKPWPSSPPSRFSAFTSKPRRRSRIPSCRDSRAPRSRRRTCPRPGNGSSSVPRGFSASSMEALVARLGRIGADQQRHQIGADRVGDPGLVAGDLVDIPLRAPRACESGKVGSGIGLGEDRGRQDFAGSDPRQPLLSFCSSVPPARISSPAISEPRAERADADPAARQLLGHQAHRLLAELQPPYSSGIVRANTPSSASSMAADDSLPPSLTCSLTLARAMTNRLSTVAMASCIRLPRPGSRQVSGRMFSAKLISDVLLLHLDCTGREYKARLLRCNNNKVAARVRISGWPASRPLRIRPCRRSAAAPGLHRTLPRLSAP
jgi:hypothetical protein